MVFDRDAVMSSSPGLPLRLPWVEGEYVFNRNAVASFASKKFARWAQPPCGCKINLLPFFSQVAEAATLGGGSNRFAVEYQAPTRC